MADRTTARAQAPAEQPELVPVDRALLKGILACFERIDARREAADREQAEAVRDIRDHVEFIARRLGR